MTHASSISPFFGEGVGSREATGPTDHTVMPTALESISSLQSGTQDSMAFGSQKPHGRAHNLIHCLKRYPIRQKDRDPNPLSHAGKASADVAMERKLPAYYNDTHDCTSPDLTQSQHQPTSVVSTRCNRSCQNFGAVCIKNVRPLWQTTDFLLAGNETDMTTNNLDSTPQPAAKLSRPPQKMISANCSFLSAPIYGHAPHGAVCPRLWTAGAHGIFYGHLGARLRQGWIILTALWLCFTIMLMAGCRHAKTPEGHRIEAKELYILNWADYIPQDVIDQFQQETGIHVVYDAFDSAETLEAKLVMGAPYDVVFPPAWPVCARLLPMKIFRPLHHAWLPHIKGLDPQVMEKVASIDPSMRYVVPYLWGTTGLAYDRLALAGRGVTGAVTHSWGLVFDPRVARQLSPGRIFLLDSPTDVLQAALMYLGHNPTTLDKKLWDLAVAQVMQVRPYIFGFEGSKQVESLVEGQSEIIQGFSTYGNMAVDKAQAMKLAKNLVYIIPKEGAMVWFDMMAIPAKAPHPRNAHLFINFLLRPDIMARISTQKKAPNAVTASYALMDPALRSNGTVFPNASTMVRIHSDCVLPVWLLRHLSRQWLKIKMGFDPR